MTAHDTDPRPPRSLLSDSRGAAFTEYLTLTAVVGLVAAAATVTVGVPLLEAFEYAQAVLSLPVP